MKVSLNKANKLRNLLEDLVSEKEREVIQLTAVAVSPFETEASVIRSSINDKRRECTAKVDEFTAAVAALFELRSKIAEANHEFGISTVMTELEMQKRSIRLLSDLEGIKPSDEHSVRYAIAENAAAGTSTSSLRGHRTITVFDRADIEGFSAAMTEMKKNIRDTEEKRNEMNHKFTLDLPDFVVGVLKSNSLI